MEENSKIIVVDGKIIDLDKVSREELDKIEKELDKEEKQVREEIDKLLGI